jgi:hypothetical protein
MHIRRHKHNTQHTHACTLMHAQGDVIDLSLDGPMLHYDRHEPLEVHASGLPAGSIAVAIVNGVPSR